MTDPQRGGRRRLRPTPTRRKKPGRWQPVVGVLLIAAAAYSAGSTYQQGEEAQRRGECQTALNRAFLESLKGRDQAARGESEAQRVLLATPSDSTDAEKRRARQRYVDALAALDRARAANPLPEVTSC